MDGGTHLFIKQTLSACNALCAALSPGDVVNETSEVSAFMGLTLESVRLTPRKSAIKDTQGASESVRCCDEKKTRRWDAV